MKALLASALALCAACAAAPQTAVLHHSVVGTQACGPRGPCFSRIMQDVRVQRFLLDLARAPIAVATARDALRGTAASAEDLLALGLVRRERERYVLSFPLFTAADVSLIRARSEHYAGSLAAALLARRPAIAAALAGYDAPGVDRKAVAYFLLGCVSLDWDGLAITADKHYRSTGGAHPDGTYVPAAEEKSSRSLQGIYWGSHTVRLGAIGFTSFGDHAARRVGLPDLLWGIPGRIATRPDDPPRARDALRAVTSVAVAQAAGTMGRVLLALRDGEKTAAELAAAAKLAPDDVAPLLDALGALEYVGERGGRYHALVPVLTDRDRALSDTLRRIGREVIEAWLAANYDRMKAELGDLSFMRSGVRFEDGYTMIWHYVFGIANRKLAEAGLFPDPYAAGRAFKGSLPAIYTLEY